MSTNQQAAITGKHYRSDTKVTWCPGCGDFSVLSAFEGALEDLQYERDQIVCVSGIGCSGRIPYFMSTYGFHGLHGRALPIAFGVKQANPKLNVFVFSGDGDSFAIGSGHFMNGARRNPNLVYVVMNNSIYGLTKGQSSPTSRQDFVTKAQPQGNMDGPVNPIALALISGATFVAQVPTTQPKEVRKIIVAAAKHKGFAFVDAYSPCPTFNKEQTHKYYRDNTLPIPEDHDPTNLQAALSLALENDNYVGTFYKVEQPTYEDYLANKTGEGPENLDTHLEKIFTRFA